MLDDDPQPRTFARPEQLAEGPILYRQAVEGAEQ